jgi:Mrp family chromosome partitioning ATPase
MQRALKKIVRGLDDCDLYLSFEQILAAAGSTAAPRASVTTVSSIAPAEGKTWVTVSLAVQASEVANKRVLVIDAAPKSRRSSTSLLASSLPAQEPDDVGVFKSHFERLHYLPVSRLGALPGDSTFSDRLAAVLAAVRPLYDLILIDGVSLSHGATAYNLLRYADRTLLVIEHRRLSVPQVRSYVTRLQKLDLPVMGAVINKRHYPVPGFIYNRL